MGIAGLPLYGEDFASVIEATKKIIEKIENGKASIKDIEELAALNEQIYEYIEKNKN